MTVTVVIPCYNEEDYVGKLLGDLARQTVSPEAVIVVDCHSKDKTVKVAEEFNKRLPLKILQSSYRSAAAARNTGADAARTDYLLFLDADMRIKPRFVSRIMRLAERKRADFVAGKLRTEGHHPVDHAVTWTVNVWVHTYHMVLKRRPAGVGGAMLVSKKLHDSIGGYSPKLREFDDVDYFRRMWEYPVSFTFARDAVATTSNRRPAGQGRLASILQAFPDHSPFTRLLVRPLMKKLGIKPKWHELE